MVGRGEKTGGLVKRTKGRERWADVKCQVCKSGSEIFNDDMQAMRLCRSIAGPCVHDISPWGTNIPCDSRHSHTRHINSSTLSFQQSSIIRFPHGNFVNPSPRHASTARRPVTSSCYKPLTQCQDFWRARCSSAWEDCGDVWIWGSERQMF